MKRYEARKQPDGTWRMFVDGKPTSDCWMGNLAESSAKLYESFWNTSYGAIVHEHGYYNAIQKGLIQPDGHGPLTIVHEQLKDLYKQEAQPLQLSLWG